MKFVDVATIRVVAGDGGNGRISFRHEKFVDRGGPDGGDGGKGGDIVFVASRNHNTLVDFRYHQELNAEHGGDGGKVRKHGRSGGDRRVAVPVGTVIYEEGIAIADLANDGEEVVIAKGGRGGFGNSHFTSSVRQAPKFAEPGGRGETKDLRLELKLIADVGLVGLPNAGKSTLLSVVSNARPEIADYPFTTLTPNLGVADVRGAGSVLIADIPGLIEGAAEGRGLGYEFLRHVERTAVLLHLVDVNSDTLVADYKTIENELREYTIDLSSRAKIVVLTKTDASLPELVKKAHKELRKVVPKTTDIYMASSQSHAGIKDLLYATLKLVKAERTRQAAEAVEDEPEKDLPVITLAELEDWIVEKIPEGYYVYGSKIDKFVERTDFDNDESVARLRNIMRKYGILHELTRRGIGSERVVRTKSGSFEL